MLGQALCSIVCGANYCFIIVTMLTLCFISLDRYLAIHRPLHYLSLVTRPRALLLVAYTWLQGAAFALAPALSGWVAYDYWEATCAIQWHAFGAPVLAYVVAAFVLCFLLPSAVLIAAYGKVLRTTAKIKPGPGPAPLPRSPRPLGEGDGPLGDGDGQRDQRDHSGEGPRHHRQLGSPPPRRATASLCRLATSPASPTVTSLISPTGISPASSTGTSPTNPTVTSPTSPTATSPTSPTGISLSPTEASPNQTGTSHNQTGISQNHIRASQNQTEASQNQTSLSQTGTSQNQTEASQNQTVTSQNNQTATSQNNQTVTSQNQTVGSQNQTEASPNQTRGSQNHHVKFSARLMSCICQLGASRSRHQQQRQQQPSRPTKRRRSETKAVRSLLVVMLAYFVCLTPFSVTKMYKVVAPESDALPGYANLLATFFQFLGSVVNPLIYGLLRQDFQRAFLGILMRTVRRRRGENNNYTSRLNSLTL